MFNLTDKQEKHLKNLADAYQKCELKYQQIDLNRINPIEHKNLITRYKAMNNKLTKLFKVYLNDELSNATTQIIMPLPFSNFVKYLNLNNQITDQDKELLADNPWLVDTALIDVLNQSQLQIAYRYNYLPTGLKKGLANLVEQVKDALPSNNIPLSSPFSQTGRFKSAQLDIYKTMHQRMIYEQASELFRPFYSLWKSINDQNTNFEYILGYLYALAISDFFNLNIKMPDPIFEYLVTNYVTTIANIYVPEKNNYA